MAGFACLALPKYLSQPAVSEHAARKAALLALCGGLFLSPLHAWGLWGWGFAVGCAGGPV